MKTVVRKLLLIGLMFISIAASVYFSYRAYHSYKHYQFVQSGDIYIDLIGHLDKTIQKLEQERLLSAIYLGYKGKIDFQIVANQREESDRALQELKIYIEKYPQLTTVQNAIQNISEDLRYVRSRVDVINGDYNDLLFAYYQNKIIQPLLQQSQLWLTKLSESIDSVAPYFTTFKELITLRDYLNQEQSYIAYVLAMRQKMSMPDLMNWENILKNEQLPYLSRLSQKSVYDLLKKSLHERELEKSLTQLRRAVLKGIGSGNYNIDVKTWMHEMQKNIDNIEKSVRIIYDYLKSLDFKEIIPVVLYMNLLVVLLAILFLLLLYKLYHNHMSPAQLKIKEKNPDIQIKHHSRLSHLSLAQTTVKENKDLPLTNIMPDAKPLPIEREEEVESGNGAISKTEESIFAERSFSPIELFKEIIEPYISISRQKNISFHYAIDPGLPDICIGEPEKIKEILTLFLNVSMKPRTVRKEVTIYIENVAQKKFDIALTFTIRDEGLHLSHEEREKIRRGYSDSSSLLEETFSPYIKDFLKARELIRQLNGTLQVQSGRKKDTEFIISINLKKFITTR